MKTTIMIFLFSLAACASSPESGAKKAETKAKPGPIFIPENPKNLASIDPETLVVTYEKNADPKRVVEQMVKAWAETFKNLQACQTEMQKLQTAKK